MGYLNTAVNLYNIENIRWGIKHPVLSSERERKTNFSTALLEVYIDNPVDCYSEDSYSTRLEFLFLKEVYKLYDYWKLGVETTR